MYLLYEKEVDEAMRTEQERLLYWISEASKLNPDASLPAILNAADDYIKKTTFKIYKERQSLFDKNEVIREAQQKTNVREAELAFLNKISQDAEEAHAENIRRDEAAAAAEAELLAQQQALEEELVEELVEDTEIPEAVAEEEVPEVETADENVSEDESELNDLEDYEEPELVVAEKVEIVEDEVKLPERDDTADALKQNRQKTVRANHDAIFSNQSDIAEL